MQQDFRALRDSRRLPLGNEAEEAAQRRQAAIASTDRVPAFCLCVLQEGAHFSGGELGQVSWATGSPPAMSGESEEQPPGVAVGTNGMNGGIALLDHPLIKKRRNSRGNGSTRFHGCIPSVTCRQCAPNVQEAFAGLLQ